MTLENVLAAPGHPVLMKIVRAPASGQETYCGAIETGAPKSTLPHRRRVLRESGVFRLRHEGHRNYRICAPVISKRAFPDSSLSSAKT
ncbi:transcriptional regulator [Streptomyces sp. ME19-01-6]|uniref:transcriptional regulator n=1 Tax=Streptomyces sp. ME19-01-6 TaxID=3028686 RepID=UPI0029A7E43E|nr:transcriptional regulator [Streptomyces sp. ME19-01-6]MDX3225123.1 transcriptional regulator [Streptomyces sp. ME19-01-6]